MRGSLFRNDQETRIDVSRAVQLVVKFESMTVTSKTAIRPIRRHLSVTSTVPKRQLVQNQERCHFGGKMVSNDDDGDSDGDVVRTIVVVVLEFDPRSERHGWLIRGRYETRTKKMNVQ